MLNRKKNQSDYKTAASGPTWRQYQNHLKSQDERRHILRRVPIYVLWLLLLAALVEGGFKLVEYIQSRPARKVVTISPPDICRISHKDLRKLLGSLPVDQVTRSDFEIKAGLSTYHMYTSLDTDLQKSIQSALKTEYAQSIGIVALETDTGRVLAMVSHDEPPDRREACLRADSPAASLFKIITAAAAMERCGLKSDTPVPFTGGKYTLYKSQLTDRTGKYTSFIPLKDAFADSINPVFGCIGKNQLGKTGLERYADLFFFNRAIDFDLPVDTSCVKISDDPYNWAEVACGFNHVTTISPLHGAMIAAAIVNDGVIMNPSVIDTVSVKGRVVYRRMNVELCQAMKPQTAEMLRTLMNATVSDGTARKAFRGSAKDELLSGLDIGGKTGSLNNNPEHVKFDWFAGFAEDSRTSKKIAVCILVAHKDYIGTRASAYFRGIISQFFKQPIETPKEIPNVPDKSKNLPEKQTPA